MPSEDASRWNLRYRGDFYNISTQVRRLLTEHSDLLPAHGLALDLAMGLGGNARYMLDLGFHVVGVDISSVAVHRVKIACPTLMAVIADLEHFFIPPDSFDVILNFLYLQWSLWTPIVYGLKTGGMLFAECLLIDMLAIHPEINPKYLLKPGELNQVFAQGELHKLVEVIHYSEGWDSISESHTQATARIIARRIRQ